MSKVRVYQVAKDLNVSSKDIISKLGELKIVVNNHMSTLEDNEVALIKKVFNKSGKKPVAEKASTPVEKPAAPVEKADQPADNKDESKEKKQKKPSWTIGTPKTNRPKRKSDYKGNRNRNNDYNKNKPNRPKTKVEMQLESIKDKVPAKQPPKPAPKKQEPPKVETKKVVEKPINDKKQTQKTAPTQKPQTKAKTNHKPSSKPAQSRPENNKTNDNRKTDKNFTKPDLPKSTGKPEAKPDNRKVHGKKKKKKQYSSNASLEDKFSKKVRGKKPKKIEKTVDNSQYYDDQDRLVVPEMVTVGKFADMLGQTISDVIMKLMAAGIMANVNQEIEYETCELIALEYDIETVLEVPVDETQEIIESYFTEDKAEDLESRPPVVTVMGHVDHGKTSLLDAIRSTAVTDREAGGITQHIGASEAIINGQKIVFLDTPGHEAFTTLRARGAQVTDIAVLVVAADDGVMPQTIEAIDHAKAAGVPIIVAINKIDKPGCNPDQVKSELSEHGILVEDWGGDVISVEVSALKNINIEGLLEMILLQAEVLELKANPDKDAVGTIIDAKVDKGRGVVTTLLVQNGTLEIGNSIVCGSAYGRVRAIFNHVGKRVKKAGPSTGVEITGLNEVPIAGDKFIVVEDDKVARQIADKKRIDERNEALKGTPQHVTLEDIFDQIQAGKTKEIKIVIKADVQGSLEALKTSLMKVSHEDVAVNIIHAAVGTVTESDVLLASASDAIVIGFNVRPTSLVESLAQQEGVELKTYRIIYEAINDVSDALIGMLDPEYKEEVLGKVEVRQTIKVPNVGMIAGCYVLEGKVTRAAEFRLVREGIVIHEGKISSLKRFKDDVKEVARGYECGIGFENFNDMKEGDILEAFHMVEIKRKK